MPRGKEISGPHPLGRVALGDAGRGAGRLARARSDGALGVATLANIRGRDLGDPLFAPVWSEIDGLGLPVFVHPTIPPGGRDMRLDEFSLATPVGFMVDTTLAFARLILSGFFDRYPNAKLIAPHGGGTLPYLSGRLDRSHETIRPAAPPSKLRPAPICAACSTTPSSTSRARWRCASLPAARTTCSTARTSRTTSAT